MTWFSASAGLVLPCRRIVLITLCLTVEKSSFSIVSTASGPTSTLPSTVRMMPPPLLCAAFADAVLSDDTDVCTIASANFLSRIALVPFLGWIE
jgi:hypothetical protein